MMATEIIGDLVYFDDGRVMSVAQAQAITQARERQRRLDNPGTLEARDPTTYEKTQDWLSDKIARVTGMDPRSANDLAYNTVDLAKWVPGLSGLMGAPEAKRLYEQGDLGGAALEGVGAALDAGALGTMARGSLGKPVNLIGGILSDARNARRAGQIAPGARLTSEAAPYVGVGTGVGLRHVGVDPARHLPGVGNLDEAGLEAFTGARTWADPTTGEDILLRAIGAPQGPAMRGQGVYTPPGGPTEYNPLTTRITGATDEQLQATEALRGLLDVQGASTWTRPNAGSQPALVVPHAPGEGSKDMIARLTDAAGQYGIPNVYDIGDAYVMTNFMGEMPKLTSELRAAVGRASGTKPITTTISSGYPSYEGVWERGAPAAARQALDYLAEADPEAVKALNMSADIPKYALSRAILDTKDAGTLGGANIGIDDLRRAIGRGGINWMPRVEDLATRSAAREIPVQPPTALRQTPEVLAARHRGPAGLLELDPAFAGSNPGIQGAERALPAPNPKQVYLGVNEGQPGGYVPEYGLQKGGVYDVNLPAAHYANVADFSAAPSPGVASIADEAEAILKRIDATRKSPMTEIERENLRAAYEAAIAKARGYSGLLAPEHEQGYMATSFYPIGVK